MTKTDDNCSIYMKYCFDAFPSVLKTETPLQPNLKILETRENLDNMIKAFLGFSWQPL